MLRFYRLWKPFFVFQKLFYKRFFGREVLLLSQQNIDHICELLTWYWLLHITNIILVCWMERDSNPLHFELKPNLLDPLFENVCLTTLPSFFHFLKYIRFNYMALDILFYRLQYCDKFRHRFHGQPR